MNVAIIKLKEDNFGERENIETYGGKVKLMWTVVEKIWTVKGRKRIQSSEKQEVKKKRKKMRVELKYRGGGYQ